MTSRRHRLAFAASCLAAAAQPAGAAAAPELDPAAWPAAAARPVDRALEQRVEEILGRLSTADKVGQIIQADISAVTPEDVRRYRLGSILAGGNSAPRGDVRAKASEWLELADRFYQASTDASEGGAGIPAIFGIDAVHGHSNIVGATVFPHNIGLGAARDPALVRRIGQVTAIEMAVTGIEWTFAPTLAVVRNDRWGRTYEGYSEHPDVVRAYAAAMVEGLQGRPGDPGRLRRDRVIATAKHFVGDGGTRDGIDQGDNLSSSEELLRVHAAGYLPAIEAGVETIMASFNSWHGHKIHGYEPLLTGVLKERWQFDGFVVGDWNGHGQVSGCTNVSCPQAINAGLDMFMAPDSWKELHANTLASVRDGIISRERLDDAVRRILRVKIRAGLLDRARPSERALAGRFELLSSAEHRAVAREAVQKSLVLLKNDGGILPIAGSARVLVAGSAADDLGRQTGGWTLSWQGTGNSRSDFPNAQSIREGISEAVRAGGGVAEFSADGSFERRPDVAVVVYGEEPYAEGFGDLPDVDFHSASFDHLRVLHRLRDQGIPVVSVFLSGRPLWVNPELNASDAFVAAWLPGTEGGGVADVLVGDPDGVPRHDFSGTLSYSWPASPEQAALNHGDPRYEPLFAYGYGLDYADDVRVGKLPEQASAARAADSSMEFVVRGRAAPPWELVLADDDGAAPAGERRAQSPTGAVTAARADYRAQEDTVVLTWSGAGSAAVSVGGATVDLRDALAEKLALGLELRIDRAPGDEVLISQSCGGNCGGSLRLADLMPLDVTGKWRRLEVPLACFAAAGAEPAAIDAPLVIESAGAFSMSLHSASLVRKEDPLPCP